MSVPVPLKWKCQQTKHYRVFIRENDIVFIWQASTHVDVNSQGTCCCFALNLVSSDRYKHKQTYPWDKSMYHSGEPRCDGNPLTELWSQSVEEKPRRGTVYLSFRGTQWQGTTGGQMWARQKGGGGGDYIFDWLLMALKNKSMSGWVVSQTDWSSDVVEVFFVVSLMRCQRGGASCLSMRGSGWLKENRCRYSFQERIKSHQNAMWREEAGGGGGPAE